MSNDRHLEETKLELGEYLRCAWPDAVNVDRDCVKARTNQRDFLAAITAMRDAGHVMYEGLMIDVYGRPRVIDAVLTHNGRDWLTAHRKTGECRPDNFEFIRPGTL